jgi:putative ABC transport system substrate-binding protein
MRHRREVIAGLGAVVVGHPFGVSAQQQLSGQPRLGILLFTSVRGERNLEAFLRALAQRGYAEGRNVAVEYRSAQGQPERLPELAADLVRTKPHVVFALGGDVSPAVAKATQSIPIVFVSSADPVRLGLVDGLSRPGRNATGVTLLLDDLASKRLELLKEAAPLVSRVGFVWNPDHPDNELQVAERASAKLGVRLQPLAVRGPPDLEQALRSVDHSGTDALYVVSSRQTVSNLDKLVAFAVRKGVPLAGGWGAWARAGGLLSYGPNLDDMIGHAADYTVKILNGAKPADLPVQQPTAFELVVNLRTAKALDLTISPSLLARADEVIE